MQNVTVNVKTTDPADRMEILVRIVYAIVIGIVSWIFSIIAGISWIINILAIIITGKKVPLLTNLCVQYWKYVTPAVAYFLLLTDERPPLFPEGIAVQS